MPAAPALGGCGGMILRGLLRGHWNDDCPEAVIDCDFKKRGCEWRGSREDLDEHHKFEALAHVDSLASAVTTLEAVVDGLRFSCVHPPPLREAEDLAIVVMRGETGNGRSRQAYELALESGRGWLPCAWLPLLPSPKARVLFCQEARLILCGNDSFDPRDTEKAWRKRIPALRSRQRGFVTTVCGGHLYVLGGKSVGGDVKDMKATTAFAQVCDLGKPDGPWTTLPVMSHARYGAHAIATKKKIYVFGGKDPVTDERLVSMECFDVDTKTWTGKAPLPDGMVCTVAIAIPDPEHLLVLGDGVILEYNPTKDTWVKDAAWELPDKRSLFAATLVAGALYVIGGKSDKNGEPLSSCMSAAFEIEESHGKKLVWEYCPPLPMPLFDLDCSRAVREDRGSFRYF
jgi:hypothetical protein